LCSEIHNSFLSFGKGVFEMVKRNVYKVNKSGMLQVTIPAVVAKMWGISDITHVCIREMAPGMFKVWAPEVVDKGVSVVDNSPGMADNQG